MELFRDSSQPVETRVSDLLSRMTLDEKLAQLGSIWGYELVENGSFSASKAEDLIKDGIGQITRVGGSTGLPADRAARLSNEIQKFLMEKSRLGIPAIVHEECLSGLVSRGATIFPQMIGVASTWDPELVEKMTEIIRKQMRAIGAHQGLSPVMDVVRDPRWGRVEETFGEDPYLAGKIGTAYVKGLQGEDLKERCIATLKHFVGYGAPEGGMNWAPAHIPQRELREVYLKPFEMAVKEGGALSVMNGYHELDGIPCGSSMELLTDILRNEWGFEGIVVSDYWAVDMLRYFHTIAKDKAEAARYALEAGIDVELPRYDCYMEPLKKLVESGQVPMDLVDRSVSRILRLKFMLGLFDHPYVDAGRALEIFDTPEQRRFAREVACRSIVLLKNESNILPLSKQVKTVAVIGPNADKWRNLLGDYTSPAQIEMMDELATVEGFDMPQWQDSASAKEEVPVVSILDGIKSHVSKTTKVLYAKGCDTLSVNKDGFREAVECAKAADVAIVVVGGKSGLTKDCTCGEMRDRATLGFLGVQEDLIKAVYETGTPTVVVLVDGRPYTLGWVAENIPGIVVAWLPGEEGGNAVADVLFGDFNPGGKLPISFPRTVGQVPVYYGHKPSGGRSQVWDDYVETSPRPLFPFGYGLSYTTFELSDLTMTPKSVGTCGKVSISLNVKNTGSMRGDEVVQVYVNDVIASVTRPVKELKAFKRVTLEPGEKKMVLFEIAIDSLAFWNREMKRVVEPGKFKVMVGTSSEDIALEGEFEVTE